MTELPSPDPDRLRELLASEPTKSNDSPEKVHLSGQIRANLERIEDLLLSGQSHKEIMNYFVQAGFDVNPNSFKSFLRRARLAERKSGGRTRRKAQRPVPKRKLAQRSRPDSKANDSWSDEQTTRATPLAPTSDSESWATAADSPHDSLLPSIREAFEEMGVRRTPTSTADALCPPPTIPLDEI